jgi:hypothetical protein
MADTPDEFDYGGLVPDEILAFGPPGGVFVPAEHPGLVLAVVTAAGGAASDGTPGTTAHRAFWPHQLSERMRVHVGRGGRDNQGRRGQDGYVLIELWKDTTHDRTG